MTARGILVAGIGNIFLGDDGFGSEAVRAFAVARPDLEGVRAVDYGIRGMHLAYDLLDGVDALVVLDAVPMAGAAPGSLQVLEVGSGDVGDARPDPHAMNPVAVLASLRSLGGELPPTYVVGCCPASLDEGIGLSAPVAEAVPHAVALARRLVDDLLAGRTPGGGDARCASGSRVG